MLNLVSLSSIPFVVRAAEDSFERQIEAVFGILVCVIMVVMLLFGERIIGLISKDSFSKRVSFSRKKLSTAYLYLAAEMLRADRVDAREKQVYIQDYINKYFPSVDRDMGFDFNHALKNSIPIDKIASWLRVHLDKPKRLQVMYFLAGLSMVDGSMNRREVALLRKMCDQLDLTPKDFDSIIAMYTQRRRRAKTNSSSGYSSSSSSSEGSSSSRSRTKPRKSQLAISCEILGVSEHASMSEVKKAYRKMVKLHHPDLFMSESEEQQKLAQERFIEIQKAYETIENLK